MVGDERSMALSDAGSEVILLHDRVQELLKDRSLLLVACIKAWDELSKAAPGHPMLPMYDAELCRTCLQRNCALWDVDCERCGLGRY